MLRPENRFISSSGVRSYGLAPGTAWEPPPTSPAGRLAGSFAGEVVNLAARTSSSRTARQISPASTPAGPAESSCAGIVITIC